MGRINKQESKALAKNLDKRVGVPSASTRNRVTMRGEPTGEHLLPRSVIVEERINLCVGTIKPKRDAILITAQIGIPFACAEIASLSFAMSGLV